MSWAGSGCGLTSIAWYARPVVAPTRSLPGPATHTFRSFAEGVWRGRMWVWPGAEHDVRTPTRIDGSLPHITMPHTGERYSLVFFAGRVQPTPTPDDVAFLRELGQPPLRAPGRCHDVRSDLLDAAAERLRRRGLTRAFVGDYRNERIPSRY